GRPRGSVRYLAPRISAACECRRSWAGTRDLTYSQTTMIRGIEPWLRLGSCLLAIFAVGGWLGSYGGEDSPNDISCGLFAGKVGVPRLLQSAQRRNIPFTWFWPGHFASQHGGESALMKNIAQDFKQRYLRNAKYARAQASGLLVFWA